MQRKRGACGALAAVLVRLACATRQLVRLACAIGQLARLACATGWVVLLAGAAGLVYAGQEPDLTFDLSVSAPAYRDVHPTVVIDEAHQNLHTATGLYAPLARLLTNDGYRITSGERPFTEGSLNEARVLIISNARVPGAPTGASDASTAQASAFSPSECTVMREWVRHGGSLLLIADHAPFGQAAEALAAQFGVHMGQGYVFDVLHSDGGNGTFLVFEAAQGALGDHPILHGRNASEEIKRIVAFTGQSLTVPAGAVALTKLSSSAYESPSQGDLLKELPVAQRRLTDPRQETGRLHKPVGTAQIVALTFGQGRVVVAGEAAMFSAQVLRMGDGASDMRFGMNVPGNDDKQFALNVLHWLSGLL
jgi:hypothetical protein